MSESINYICYIGSDLNKDVNSLRELLEQAENINILCVEPNKVLTNTFPSTPGHIGIQTSGTTGIPKVVWKNYKDIFSAKRGNGSSADSWLLTYSPIRWAGLSVILHTIKTKSTLIIPKSFFPNDLLEDIRYATHISITPSLFRKLQIVDINKLALAQIQQLTFGGEYATQKVLDDAKAIWPHAKITHIYATTEFGDICACSDGLEGIPLNKIKKQYSISDQAELIIDGMSTGDMWKISNDRLYFMGRVVESINIGGAKVSQSTVENAANSISGVTECRAYSITNPLLGQVVGLDYVGTITVLELKKQLLKLLPKYAVPAKFNQVENIGLTAAGKIVRKE